jgi:uncharacterized sporulation protein YeaH/YhbH (DUF444 family)
MPQFIDRRLNPRDKSLGNRMRFLKRTRARIKEAVDKAVRERTIGEAAKGGSVTIPSDGVSEPMFHESEAGGDRQRVLPGNKEFVSGDRIDKPKGGQGGRGRQGAKDGDGEDDFTFALTEEEFLDLLFEDLELPDLVKSSLKDAKLAEPRRAGFSADGMIPNLNVLRTMRQSLSRRLALRRPSRSQVEKLEDRLAEIAALPETEALSQEKADIEEELKRLRRRQHVIPFIDPIDVRYNRFTRVVVPRAKAAMFCLMDVSASMGEREKDLAKRFFILLHLFLRRKYERVDVIFIRHTHEAKEVDEQEFFYGRETGGTVVSSALERMIEIRDERYSPAEWNIYCAQASDGDNSGGDTEHCVELLTDDILPQTQYFAYIEIADRDISAHWSGGDTKELWRGYSELVESERNFAMRKASNPADIYPVFRELFARQRQKGTSS